jgi:hypothetical protein
MTRRIAAAALLVLGLLVSFFAVAKAEEARGLEGLWTARYETPQPLPRSVKAPEGGMLALVRENSREISAPLFARAKRLTVIETAGDASLLFLPGQLVSGVYPVSARNCVIDRASAVELWGTDSPLGFAVECGGVEYEVSGVVAVVRPLLLVGNGEDFEFTSVLFRANSSEKFPSQIFHVLTEGLSPEQPLIEETGLLSPRMRFLALLPLWLMLMLAARRYLLRLLPGGRPVRAAAMIGIAVLGFWLLRIPNPLTPEMLPTYWSDFSFWPRRFEALLEYAASAWLLRGTVSGLLLTLDIVLPVVGCVLLACTAFWAAAKSRGRSSRS